ncbi:MULTISPECIES: LuxR C-terminal-related transcriptional regulator [unclassified Salinibacterium]|uniref:LuxR C-terminal-related transcriptional regulator n=1 Tax=unclassified Salinibacterium TaxID=2632331 RepID=UPI0018CE3B46|nr:MULTISPECIES: LuxR C-terminal-related transcriptional regulator [unclassified Salinibacterium]MBH0053538.1 helix-turn-helix transcriptional regulator [Salinibacterium sp. SWN139]MBH0082806.1 helix-turn-helix transcriptional regulator [Salinibacterium sp. SWN167]
MTQMSEPSDFELIQQATREIAASTGFSLSFGGLTSGIELTVSAFSGARTGNLDGLKVRRERGLGGLAMAQRSPRFTRDYEHSADITHDYDGAVLGEGVVSLLAIPIIAGGTLRGLIYAGSHSLVEPDTAAARPAVAIATALGNELAIRDEVTRRMVALRSNQGGGLSPVAEEHLREQFAQLRQLAATVSDRDVRQKLHEIGRGLSQAVCGGGDDALARSTVRLSPRETDVLSCVALGYSNARTAALLSLTEQTVKGYLGSAMKKLDASSRFTAVSTARKLGLMP